jgi:hypothetical protein
LAQKVFGRAGTELLPLLVEGEQGMAALMQQADELGLTMSTESATAAERLGDALGAAWLQLKQMGITIGEAVAGPLTSFVESMHGVLASVIGFLKEHPFLAKAIAALALILGAAATAALTLGTIFTIITAHPIIAALAAIAALTIAIAKYFGWAGDGAAGFADELSKVKAESGIESVQGQAADLRAKAVQEQLQAAVAQTSVSAVPQAAATSAEASLSRQALDEIARYTEGSMNYLRDIVTLMRNGQSGGILVGTG